MNKTLKIIPGSFVVAFAVFWTVWKLIYASQVLLPNWDAVVYWINGQAYLQGRSPLYEFFRPPVLPLILGLGQFLGMQLGDAFALQPLATGVSGIFLFLLLRQYVRDWLASIGSVVFLMTSIVQFWSTTILTHGFTTLFLLAGLYVLTKYSFKRLILGAALLSVAVFTRYPIILVALPLVLFYAIRFRKIVDVDAVIIGGVLPLVPFLLSYPAGLLEIVQQITQAEVLGQKSFFVGGPPPPVSPLLYFAWFANNLQLLLVFLALGFISIAKTRKGVVFALWFVPYVVGFSFFSNRQERFIFEVAPAFAALVVLGAEYALQNYHRRTLLGIVFVLLVGIYGINETFVMLPGVQSQWEIPFGGFSSNPTGWTYTFQIVGREIQAHSLPMDIVVAEDKVPWLSYYSSRYVYLSHLAQVSNSLTLENFLRSFHPYPVLLVAVPSVGDNIRFLDSLGYLSQIEHFNTPAWGEVYLYRASLQ